MATLLALPILIFDNLPQAGADSDQVTVETAVIRVDAGRDDLPSTTVAVPAPTAVAPPATDVPTSVPPEPAPSTHPPQPVTTRAPAAPAPSTTAATAPTMTTVTTPPPPTGNSESGRASWYDHRDGICAHRTLPLGTIVTVANIRTGASVTCEVGDRGPYVRGRIIDLDDREFSQIAALSSGVVDVRITW